MITRGALRAVRCSLALDCAFTSTVCTRALPQRTRTLISHFRLNAGRTLCSDASDKRDSSTSLSDNMISPSSVHSSEFKQEVLNFVESLGSSIKDADLLMPAFLHKSYLMSNGKSLNMCDVKSGEQLSLLGYTATRRFIAEALYSEYPNMSAQQLWDLQNGILDEIACRFTEDKQLMRLVMFKNQEKDNIAIQAVFSILGSIYVHEGPEKVRSVVKSAFISQLHDEGLQRIIKLQHPKYLLKCISQISGKAPLKTVLLESQKMDSECHMDHPYRYLVSVFLGEECIGQAMGYSLEKAEKKACQQGLLNTFPNQLEGFSLSYDKDGFMPEDLIDLGLQTHGQRLVDLEKGDESFGFNIKGGEKKRLKNEQWLIYRYYSPVFVASISPGGVADRHGGLQVGDVLLAINDRSLVGLDHAQVVRILQTAKGIVTLTVKHDKEVILTDEIESRYKVMKRRKFMAELTSEEWAEWHQAQADKNPAKYSHAVEQERIS